MIRRRVFWPCGHDGQSAHEDLISGRKYRNSPREPRNPKCNVRGSLSGGGNSFEIAEDSNRLPIHLKDRAVGGGVNVDPEPSASEGKKRSERARKNNHSISATQGTRYKPCRSTGLYEPRHAERWPDPRWDDR